MNGLLALFGTYRVNKNYRVTVNAVGHPLSKKNTDASVVTKINYDTHNMAIQVVSNTTSNVFAVSGLRNIKKNFAAGVETKYFAKEETFESKSENDTSLTLVHRYDNYRSVLYLQMKSRLF